MNSELLTVHNIWKDKNLLPWIKTYKTVLKYVSSEYSSIFKPITKGKKTGKRYFVKRENVDKFVKMFENNQLPNQQ